MLQVATEQRGLGQIVPAPLEPLLKAHVYRSAKPDAVALWKEDHRKVDDLFEKFEKARGEDRKHALVRQIRTELVIHTMIEEEIFYPACKGEIEDDGLLEESYVEHDGAPDAEFYDAKVTLLSEMIKHHVKEEEKRSEGLFAQARDAGLDIEALGEHMMARKEALKRQFADGDLPPPHTRSFSGHKLAQDHPVEAVSI